MTQYERDQARMLKNRARKDRKLAKHEASRLREHYIGWWFVLGRDMDGEPETLRFREKNRAEEVIRQSLRSHKIFTDDEGYEIQLDGFLGLHTPVSAGHITGEEWLCLSKLESERRWYIGYLQRRDELHGPLTRKQRKDSLNGTSTGPRVV